MGNKIGGRRQAVEERYTRPHGLYDHRDIDFKKLRRLILDSKLAPCIPGADEPAFDLEECPICFLYYPSLNRSRCCMKGICTECFLQMKPHHSASATRCPFCKSLHYAVEYRGVKTKEEKGMDQIEEQKVIEAQIRMRQQELKDEKERIQRRDFSSSRRIATAGDVDNHGLPSELSVLSARFPFQGHEFVPPQISMTMQTRRRHLQPRQNRSENFDLDLEDLMVMEAIWLSIQETGNQRNATLTEAEPFRSRSYLRPSLSDGLARAVATMAEQQLHSSRASTVDSTTMIDRHPEGRIDAGEQRDEENDSYARSNFVANGATAALSLPGSNILPPGHLLPDSFDEQVMLATAISLADP